MRASAALLIVLLGCAPASEEDDGEELAELWASAQYDSLQVERLGCFGWCPAYRLTFHRGGKVLAHVDPRPPRSTHG